MELDLFKRRESGEAEDTPTPIPEIMRAETTQEADDGQQYLIMLLDADDSFDVVVQYPDNQREIVWSLVRERYGQDT